VQSRSDEFATTAHASKVARIEECRFCLIPEQLAGWFFTRKKPPIRSDLINPVDGAGPLTVSVRGVQATHSVARLHLAAIAFRTCCLFIIPPSNVLTLSRGNCSAYGFLSREEGFSTCLEQSSSKRFTKRWMIFAAACYRIGCKGFVACRRKNPDKSEFHGCSKALSASPLLARNAVLGSEKQIVNELSASSTHADAPGTFLTLRF